VASISVNLESKSGTTPPRFLQRFPSISDLSFSLYFGLLSALESKFVKGVVCLVKHRVEVKK